MIIDDTRLARLIDLGFAAAHLGEPAKARALFENLLVYKEHAPTRIGLAFTYLVTDALDEAERRLRDILAKKADDAEALALLGITLGFARRFDEAGQILEHIPKNSAAEKLVEALTAA